MVQQIEGKSIGKKSLLVLLKLVLPTSKKPNPPAPFPCREGGVGLPSQEQERGWGRGFRFSAIYRYSVAIRVGSGG